MLKYSVFFIALFICLKMFCQEALIAFQGFEPEGSNWSPLELSTAPCNLEGDTWNYVTSIHQISPSQGNWFWGIEDLNGACGSSDFEWLALPEIDISRHQDVRLTFDLWVEGFDNGDDIAYELILDSLPAERVLLIEGASDYSTGGWVSTEIPISNKIRSVGLRLMVKQNGSDHAGIDNIALRGYPDTECSELMISEYLEGSSSTSHRNNFIEIYNPTGSWIQLQGYSLVKFTGKQTEISASMRLSDSIAPYATYLIEDNGEILGIEADLSSNSAVMDFNGDDKIGLMRSERIIDLIGVPGDSVYFARDITLRRKSMITGPNSEFDYGEWDSYGLEETGDLNVHAAVCEHPLPEIRVSANGLEIKDGNQSTNKKDNTYFGYLPFGESQPVFREFLLENTGNAPLNILGSSLSGPDHDSFRIETLPDTALQPGENNIIRISFLPERIGLHQAVLRLVSDDPSESNYDILLQAEGSGISQSPLMITQYYEGVSNDRWVEVTNISGQRVEDGSYYLALFRQDLLDHPLSSKPSIKKAIPSTGPGETILFRASLNVNQPEYALDGSDIPSGVCGFTGDDVLVISSSGEEQCWIDRTDMIGRQGNWGEDISYVRKYGCDAVRPYTGFLPQHWLPYALDEVNSAQPGHNRRLGEHHTGATVFIDGSWSNGLPDLNKSAEISETFMTSKYGNIECCSLLISSNGSVLVEDSNYIAVENDLVVHGSLQIENGGSLLMINSTGQVLNHGSITVNKRSAPLDQYDYTYWSSPVNSANLDSVFRESPKAYRFYYDTRLFTDANNDGLNDNAEVWQSARSLMEIGKGYAIMAPDDISNGDQQSVSFKGSPNNGTLKVPLRLNRDIDGDQDWNLIGNPYPSPIDLERLINDPDNEGLMGGTCYFWTHSTSVDEQGEYSADDYAIYSIGIGGVRASGGGPIPNKFVDSGQGFFIEARQEGNLSYKNDMRAIPTAVNFYKSNGPVNNGPLDRLWLNLRSGREGFNQFLLGFVKQATQLFDEHYDALRLTANAYFSFYSPLEKKRLAIRGEPGFSPMVKIPLGIEIRKRTSEKIEIELEQAEGKLAGLPVYLHDKYLLQVHDLQKSNYEFACPDPGVYEQRFELSFHRSVQEEESAIQSDPRILWHIRQGLLELSCSGGQIIDQVILFDLLGRRIRELHVGERQASIPLDGIASNAIYILQLKTMGGLQLDTKIVQVRP